MEQKIKKLGSILGFSLLAYANTTFAFTDRDIRNLENRITAIEQSRSCPGVIIPSTRPCVSNGFNFWGNIEALYVRPIEDGLMYKLDTTVTQNLVAFEFPYDWTWGFKAGIGFSLPHDGWDVTIDWTRIHSPIQSKATATITSDGVIQDSSKAAPNPNEPKYKLALNIASVQIGRECFISKWFILRPYMGIQGICLKRPIDPDYNNHFRGAGLQGGFHMQWGLGNGFSFYGETGVSLIYGQQAIRELNQTQTKTADHFIICALTELEGGIRWDNYLYDERYRLSVKGGMKQSLFWHFGNGYTGIVSNDFWGRDGKMVPSYGNLALNGIALEVSLDF